MTTNTDFAIWCARKCLHLWDATDEVKEWLEDPKPETAEPISAAADDAAYAAWAAPQVFTCETGADAAEAAADATYWAAWAEEESATERAAERAAHWAAKALHTPVTDLKLEYVKTWTDDELGKADDPWIEAATVEILNRM